MTKEEKAKAYDETLERAKKWYDANTNEGYRGIFEEIFPELAESEDERIRKELLNYLYDSHDDDEERARWIAWLEKQGEQKPVVPKFMVGDTVRAKTMNDFVFTIKDITDKQYIDTNGGKFDIEGQDYLELVEHKPVEWNNDLEKEIANFAINGGSGDNTPTIGEIAHHFVEWQKKKQKPTWSEEDEKMIESLTSSLYRISTNTRTDSTSPNYTFYNEITWLKSLKDRYTWKPSDEQMKALYEATLEGEPVEALKTLLSDLKKLKG